MNKINSILIVDDSKENIDALRSMLDEEYKVFVAINGTMALKTLERIRPDIVLLDVLMPDINGFEVLKNMKSSPELRNIPVIFLTSHADAFSEAKGLRLGAVDYITKPYNPDIVTIKLRNQLENKLYRDNLEQLIEQRTEELAASREAIIMGMSLLAEGRDLGTGAHLKRMQKYTSILANKLYELHPEILSLKEVNDIVLLAPLHDIGKVYIPDAILLKKGKLTAEEFEEIKKHTVFGADVLRKTQKLLKENTSILSDAVAIAESHHEKYDGSGYPNGLVGSETPISARIVALADVYDALTSKRDYKEAFAHNKAMDIILNGDGRTKPEHFDPIILEVFKQVSDLFKAVE